MTIASIVYIREGCVYDFEVLKNHNYLAAGVVSHNSGKTCSTAAEVASAALGKPIIGPDGKPLPHKYPLPSNRPLTIWTIAWGEAAIGQTAFRILFRPGAFKIIKDLFTGEMRAYRPWDPADKAREEECQQSPPFISKRYIDPKGWGWKDQRQRVFTVCRLKNGTEIYAFTSNAKPKQGDPVDLIWIDEDIQFTEHVAEWQARLSDRKGRLLWSAFPHGKNEALADMSRRAEAQKHLAKPDVEEVVLTFSDNPFIEEDEKRKRIGGWSEDERRARDQGEFIFDTVQMFPTFSTERHCIDETGKVGEQDNGYCRIDKLIRDNGFQPPLDWTRYLALDPGHSHPAVLFAAVPPPKWGDYLVLYDEIYLRNVDAETIAKAVVHKSAGQNFEAFIIDNRAGRQTPMGFNWTIADQYSRAFSQVGLISNQTKSEFAPGSDDVLGRSQIIRSWLQVRPEGPPKIRVVERCCPNLVRQFRDYRKKMTADELTDMPVKKGTDMMDATGYLVAFSPVYKVPDQTKVHPGSAYLAYKEWQTQGDKNRDKSFHMGAA